MTPQLADEYLAWLEPQIRDEYGHQSRGYWDLLRLMHATEFKWAVPHDDNRIEDGRDLRAEFCHDKGIPSNSLRDIGPVSFLEVLIGLSRRLSFNAGGNANGWAWNLLSNLELHRMGDPLTPRKARKAESIIQDVIERNYRPDGGGGFFPLIDADEDQTQVELWYQMSAYIGEIHPEHIR